MCVCVEGAGAGAGAHLLAAAQILMWHPRHPWGAGRGAGLLGATIKSKKKIK